MKSDIIFILIGAFFFLFLFFSMLMVFDLIIGLIEPIWDRFKIKIQNKLIKFFERKFGDL